MTSSGIQPWRWLVKAGQAALIMGIPFLTVRGESAFRFDVPSLTLHVFGVSLAIDEFLIVLAATLFITFLIVLITVLFGRIWCGWLCPQTVIGDLMRLFRRQPDTGPAGTAGFLTITFLVSVIVGASLIWYFVSPYEFFGRLAEGTLGTILWGFWISLTTILFLNFAFLGNRFCKTVCPYAKLQGSLYDGQTLVIALDGRRRSECINCRACVRACPVGIDIRDGLSAACITCAECIDACSRVMRPSGKSGLIGYFFGSPGTALTMLRQNVILIGSVTALSLVFLLALAFGREQLDLTVLPNASFQPRPEAGGIIVNSYVLALRNRGSRGLTFTLRIEGANGPFATSPSTITLSPGEYRKVPVLISGPIPAGSAGAWVHIVAESAAGTVRKRAYLRGATG